MPDRLIRLTTAFVVVGVAVVAAGLVIAAEHLAFADECNSQSGYTVADLGAALIDAPIWSFWWD